MSFGPYETQKSVYEILTGDATLMAMISGVFDNVPDDQAYPYVTIGDNQWLDRGSHTTEGLTGTVNVYVWSRSRGRKEILTIQKRIDELLHKQEPNVDGWVNVNFRRDFSDILIDQDNTTYQGIQRFNLLIGGDHNG